MIMRLFLNSCKYIGRREKERERESKEIEKERRETRHECRKTTWYVNVFAFYPCTLTPEKLITIEWIATAISSLTRSKDRVACSFCHLDLYFWLIYLLYKNYLYLYTTYLGVQPDTKIRRKQRVTFFHSRHFWENQVWKCFQICLNLVEFQKKNQHEGILRAEISEECKINFLIKQEKYFLNVLLKVTLLRVYLIVESLWKQRSFVKKLYTTHFAYFLT